MADYKSPCLYLDIFEMLCWLLLLRHREILYHVKPSFPVFFWNFTTNATATCTNRIFLSVCLYLSVTHTHTLNAHSNISSLPSAFKASCLIKCGGNFTFTIVCNCTWYPGRQFGLPIHFHFHEHSFKCFRVRTTQVHIGNYMKPTSAMEGTHKIKCEIWLASYNSWNVKVTFLCSN